LTPAQVKAIEKADPSFKERHVESQRPGQLLSQDTFYVGHLKGVGKVYVQAVVDTYGSYGFAYLHTAKLPEHAAAILHSHVLPQYKLWKLPVEAVLTDKGANTAAVSTMRMSSTWNSTIPSTARRRSSVRRPTGLRRTL